MKRIAVIGGGASGMIAAITASLKCDVTVFEKQDRLLKKVKASGNGQCNISNSDIRVEKYHGSPSFAVEVIDSFDVRSTEKFFSSIGIPFASGKSGKLYPYSYQSSSVVNALQFEAERCGVKIRCGHMVDSIVRKNNVFEVTTAGHETDRFDAVILACGSCSYPSLGGSAVGYDLAASLGLKVLKPFPSIIPINVPLKKMHRLEGIKWDCALRVLKKGHAVASSTGELLFTKYGISGPVSLDISRHVNDPSSGAVEISIDLFPLLAQHSLFGLLSSVCSPKGRALSFALEGVLKHKMPQVFLEMGGFDCDLVNAGKDVLGRLAGFLKDIRVRPGEPRAFGEAVVAAGGVSVDQINPATMECLRVRGLYVTGEILNVDGDTGGFNLQFAWSSGYLAGKAVRPS